jgi:hypothetical protein
VRVHGVVIYDKSKMLVKRSQNPETKEKRNRSVKILKNNNKKRTKLKV